MKTTKDTLAYILSHPTRQKIVRALNKKPSLTVHELSEFLDLREEIVGFHLMALEQHGLVASEFAFANPRSRAEARFQVTKLVKEAVDSMATLV